jgi:membrane fusion protein (multidrug efflux system)
VKNKIVFMTAVALLFVSCGKKEEAVEPQTIQQIQAEKGIPVTTSNIEQGTIRHIEKSNGNLKGISETVLANGVGGTLGRVHVSVGQTVKKGRTVATMILDGGSPVDVAQSNYDYAKQVYDRAVKLHGEGAVSQEQVEGARAQYEGAKIQLGQAKVGISITTPFTGTVLEIFQNRGSKISAKTPIVKVADLSVMQVDMQINERSINYYKEGLRAFITVDQDTVWGKVTRTALAANGMSHSFRVTAQFDNKAGLLKSGMFKDISIIVDEKNDALKVPFEVASFEGDETFVYVANGAKAEKRAVELGIRNGTEFEILSGISAGEEIVLTGTTMINDGTKINVVNR